MVSAAYDETEKIKEGEMISLSSDLTDLPFDLTVVFLNDKIYFPLDVFTSVYGQKTIYFNLKGSLIWEENRNGDLCSPTEKLAVNFTSSGHVKKLRNWLSKNEAVLAAYEDKKISAKILESLIIKEDYLPSFWKKMKIKMVLFNSTRNGGKKVTTKTFRSLIIGAVVVAVLIVLAFASFTVISPTQRGVKITMGKAGDTVLQPGMTVKAPFFQSVKKYDLSPKQLEMSFTMGQDAAVTLDMQSVACNMVVYWTYDEARILDIVNGYTDSSIKNLVKDNTLGAIKEVIGKYSIYDVIEKQDEVALKVRDSLIARLEKYPVAISNLTINNWDWSQEFDAQIANTMKMAQQVKVAQQELEVTKQQAQKQVAEANAAKEKAEIEAKMKVTVAEQEALAKEKQAQGQANAARVTAEADAYKVKVNADAQANAAKINADAQAYKAKVEADAQAYAKEVQGKAEATYYSELNKYSTIIETLRKLDIESERAERWNGAEVSQYIPLTAAGGIVTVK